MDQTTQQTQVSDHDLLIRIDEKLNNLNDSNKKIEERLTDHETRLRVEEKHSESQDGAISALKWALGIFSAATTIVTSLLSWYFNR
jgi:hypothetical protein